MPSSGWTWLCPSLATLMTELDQWARDEIHELRAKAADLRQQAARIRVSDPKKARVLREQAERDKRRAKHLDQQLSRRRKDMQS